MFPACHFGTLSFGSFFAALTAVMEQLVVLSKSMICRQKYWRHCRQKYWRDQIGPLVVGICLRDARARERSIMSISFKSSQNSHQVIIVFRIKVCACVFVYMCMRNHGWGKESREGKGDVPSLQDKDQNVRYYIY